MEKGNIFSLVRGLCLFTLSLLVIILLTMTIFHKRDNPNARGFGGLALEENEHCPVVTELSIQPIINPFATSLGCPVMSCPHPPKEGECPNPPFSSVDSNRTRLLVHPSPLLTTEKPMVSVIVEVIEGVDFFTKIPPKSDRLEMEARVPRHCRYHLAYSPSTGMWSHPLVIPHGPPSDDSSAFPAKLCQEKVDASPNGLTHKIAYDDIFQVRCYEPETWTCLGSNIHALNLLKRDTLSRAIHHRDKKKKMSPPPPPSPPSLYEVAGKKDINALVLFIDNMSLQAFYETMPLTMGWLQRRMAESSEGAAPSHPKQDFVTVHQFLRYNTVGNRSNPNITPMFRGHSSDDTHANLDRKYVWQHFRDHGYVTLWSVEQCADYMDEYWEGNTTESDYEFIKIFCDSTYGKVAERNRCVQQEYAHKHLWNYLKQFIQNHRAVPWMALSLFMENHDGFCLGRTGGIMDSELRDFFEWMFTQNLLNETVVMLLSDHGAQDHLSPHYHTLSGSVEFHNPTLVITTPKWMSDAFPEEFKAFGENQQRLVTSYNIFQTMMHLLNFPNPTRLDPPVFQNRSLPFATQLSLFQPIPKTLSCKGAGIPPEFCNCDTKAVLSKKLTYIPLLITLLFALWCFWGKSPQKEFLKVLPNP